MINEKSLDSVEKARFSTSFRRPLYSNYSFYQIPKTIRGLFSAQSKGLPEDTHTEGPFDQVVLLLIDAFGWAFFEHYLDTTPFLKRVKKDGICSKLTSLFPSTTAAHITCIQTELAPNRSGIYEWFIYEPKLNEIITPLLFNHAGERSLNTLNLDPSYLYPQKTLFQTLKEEGIQSHCIVPQTIVDSTYSNSVMAGAQKHGYTTPEQGLNSLLDTLKPNTYAFFYFPDVDSIGHRSGVFTKPFSEAIHEIFSSIDVFASRLPPKTALLVTADHGMVDVSPKKTIYLNQLIPNMAKYLKFGTSQKPLVPAGSCRDLFLHVREECQDELSDLLTEYLADKAEVHRVDNLIEEGLFGPMPTSDHFLNRVGDLAILPYEKEAVWWFEKGRFEQNFYGAHGGLTPQEMEIPFLFLSS